MKSLKLKRFLKIPPLSMIRLLEVRMRLPKLAKRQVRVSQAGKLRLMLLLLLTMSGLNVRISLSVIAPNTSILLLASALKENTVLSQAAKQAPTLTQPRAVHVLHSV